MVAGDGSSGTEPIGQHRERQVARQGGEEAHLRRARAARARARRVLGSSGFPRRLLCRTITRCGERDSAALPVGRTAGALRRSWDHGRRVRRLSSADAAAAAACDGAR